MIVTIHQPEHLPWLGLFHKVRRADVFVVLDSVPFRKNYFQNRNRLLSPNGPYWVTVPVLHHGVDKSLHLIRTNETVRWREKILKGVAQNYRRHPCFETNFAWLDRALRSPDDRLVSINLALFDEMASRLGVPTRRVLASDLRPEGAKSGLVLDICRRIGATRYLSGPTGRDYLDLAAFEAAGIAVDFHRFSHPTYAQAGWTQRFQPQLSALDALMNLGPVAAGLLDDGVPSVDVESTSEEAEREAVD